MTEPRYQVTRTRIIGGVKRKSGETVTAADIPDHEWQQHATSGDFWPALPRRKPIAEQQAPVKPEKTSKKKTEPQPMPVIGDEINL